MNELTIKSRKTRKVYNSWMPSRGGYVRLVNPDYPGVLGQQICEGGWFSGSTLSATPETFEAVCRKWYKQHNV